MVVSLATTDRPGAGEVERVDSLESDTCNYCELGICLKQTSGEMDYISWHSHPQPGDF